MPHPDAQPNQSDRVSRAERLRSEVGRSAGCTVLAVVLPRANAMEITDTVHALRKQSHFGSSSNHYGDQQKHAIKTALPDANQRPPAEIMTFALEAIRSRTPRSYLNATQ